MLIQVGDQPAQRRVRLRARQRSRGPRGPLRITAAGWATPAEVRRAATIVFGLAMVIGLCLVWVGGAVILALGVFSIVAGWAYSGGSQPISHGAVRRTVRAAVLRRRRGRAAAITCRPARLVDLVGAVRPRHRRHGVRRAVAQQLSRSRRRPVAGRRTLAAVLGPRAVARVLRLLLLLPLRCRRGLRCAPRPAVARAGVARAASAARRRSGGCDGSAARHSIPCWARLR